MNFEQFNGNNKWIKSTTWLPCTCGQRYGTEHNLHACAAINAHYMQLQTRVVSVPQVYIKYVLAKKMMRIL